MRIQYHSCKNVWTCDLCQNVRARQMQKSHNSLNSWTCVKINVRNIVRCLRSVWIKCFGAYDQVRKCCPSKLHIRFRTDNVFWKYQSCVTLLIWISSLKNSLYTIYDQRSLKDRFKIVCKRAWPLQISQTNQRKDVQESAATITRQTARMSICRISTLATLNKKQILYHVYTNLALKFDATPLMNPS